MSGLKTYNVIENDDPECSDIVRAETRAKAMYGYQQSRGGEWTALRAYRVPWLDEYDDPKGPDATMAMLRHGWHVPYDEYAADAPFADDLEVYECTVSECEFDDYARRHAMPFEDMCRLYADNIGAAYPDKFKPTEEEA